MALQVWLPLNGNLKNKGIKKILCTSLGTVAYQAGKIGTAFKSGGETQVTNGISLNTNFLDMFNEKKTCSVAVWVKPLGNHYHYNGTILSSGDWNTKRWAFGVSQDNTKVDVLCYGHNTYVNCSVPVNEWTHLVSVYNNKVCTLYKNGEFVASYTCSSDFDSDAQNTCIGRETYANGYFGFNGLINDIRIYDHCLSKKEIKDISKGLVLHYKFNDLIKNEVTFNLTSSTYSISNYASRTSGYITNNIYHANGYQSDSSIDTSFAATSRNYITLQPNTVYYLSFYCKCKNNTSVYFGTENHCYTGFKTTSNTYIRPLEQVTIGTVYDGMVNLKLQTSSETNYYISLGFDNPNLFGVGSYIEFSNVVVSLQKPDHYIVPNQQNIIHDCSGYKHNGTLYGTFMQNDVTPRHSYAVEFNGSDNSIGIGNLSTITPSGTFTFNCWFKVESLGSKSWGTIIGGPSGFEFQSRRSTGTEPTLVAYSWGQSGSGGKPYTLNTWNMVSMVRTTSNCKFYLNGELYYTGSAGSIPSGDYFLGSWKTSSSQNYKGLMSDARLYATALSDSDINELYNDVAMIDKNGNLMCYEYTEQGDEPQIGKTGVVKSSLILESQTSKFKVLSDGSVWVQLLHHNNPSTNLFTQSNCWNYDDGANLYSALFLLKKGNFMNAQGQYEFLACEKLTSASTETVFRWKQTSNPSVSSTITGFSAISGSSSYSYRGLLTNGNYGCMHNGNTWWGCCGSYTPYQGGIPGFGNVITTGYLDLYVRVSDEKLKGSNISGTTAFYKESILTNQLLEY